VKSGNLSENLLIKVMTTPASRMVSSGVRGIISSLSSNSLKYFIENEIAWTPVILSYMYFNDQGYNGIEMKVSVKSATKAASRKVKKQI
jgi:hypothetical protein